MIELLNLDMDQITVGDRLRGDMGPLRELAASIQERGLIQPIAVVRTEDKYRLLAGGRRYAACAMLELSTIPVRVYPLGTTELEARRIELAENIDRKQMSWQEEIAAKTKIHELYTTEHGKKVSNKQEEEGWTQAKTADLLGESKAGISQDMALARAIEIFPELANCTTKKDAASLLAHLKRKGTKYNKRDALNALVKTKDKKSFADWYTVGDSFDFLSTLEADSFDLVDADPPYGINDADVFEDTNTGQSIEYIEAEPDYTPYITKLLVELHRVVKPTGWVILWHSYLRTGDIQQVAREIGFTYCKYAIWYKPFTKTTCYNFSLNAAFEPFFYLRKGPATLDSNQSDVFLYNKVANAYKVHPAEKPIELMQTILDTFVPAEVGRRILVPFAGSGNTLLAAANLGHTALGCDASAEYRDSYLEKLLKAEPGSYTSFTEGCHPQWWDSLDKRGENA